MYRNQLLICQYEHHYHKYPFIMPHCCGTVIIYCSSGSGSCSGSYYGKLLVPFPVPVPVPDQTFLALFFNNKKFV
jgi:hypothetical protein